MPLTPTAVLMNDAASAGHAIAAFNVIHLETAEALIGAAEDTGMDVILQISENCVRYHGELDPIARACAALAEASTARVALHLDHAESEELALHAISLGFGSIMYDGAHLDYDENVAATRRMADAAQEAGVFIEAELGEVGGKDGAHAPGVRTDPAEAAAFVEATGVDALAVAVGSSHAMTERTATVDLELIHRLAAAVPIPLVLHGSSGVSDERIASAITAGMTKINVSTQLNKVFTAAIRQFLDDNPEVVDSRRYIAAGRAALRIEAARLLRVFALESPELSPLSRV